MIGPFGRSLDQGGIFFLRTPQPTSTLFSFYRFFCGNILFQFFFWEFMKIVSSLSKNNFAFISVQWCYNHLDQINYLPSTALKTFVSRIRSSPGLQVRAQNLLKCLYFSQQDFFNPISWRAFNKTSAFERQWLWKSEFFIENTNLFPVPSWYSWDFFLSSKEIYFLQICPPTHTFIWLCFVKGKNMPTKSKPFAEIIANFYCLLASFCPFVFQKRHWPFICF